MSQPITPRRTIVKGAARAVPVVTLAAAAPALAASSTCQTTYAPTMSVDFVFQDNDGRPVPTTVSVDNLPLIAKPGDDLLRLDLECSLHLSPETVSAHIGDAYRSSGALSMALDVRFSDGTTITAYPILSVTPTTADLFGGVVETGIGTSSSITVPTDTPSGPATITVSWIDLDLYPPRGVLS